MIVLELAVLLAVVLLCAWAVGMFWLEDAAVSFLVAGALVLVVFCGRVYALLP
jgi:hypothetical protein